MPGEEGHLDGVAEHVLRVACAELEPSQVVQQLLVQAGHVRLLGGFLAQSANVLLHLLLGFLDDLLDPGGVNPAVLDQLLQRDLGDLAANAVEAGHDDHSGRVVDDHIHAGRLLECPDVPPFAADDPALHLVAGNVDRADGDLGGVRGGIALDGRREDFSRARCWQVSRTDASWRMDQPANLTPQLFFHPLQEHRAGFLGDSRPILYSSSRCSACVCLSSS